MKAGIQRVIITDPVSGRGAWRFEKSKLRYPAANKVYRETFAISGMPLLPGYEEIRCTQAEFVAGYDHELGIDVVLNFESGICATLQEKFLYTTYRTVTVEYEQNWRTGEFGDWFNMKAQYYFVGYDRNDSRSFDEWILLDWPAAARLTAMGQLRWQERRNKRDGARASFKYLNFAAFPDSAVVAVHMHGVAEGHDPP